MNTLTTLQEHTGSYYAASANDETRYPRLGEDTAADVCVIGAGFTGISTALCTWQSAVTPFGLSRQTASVGAHRAEMAGR